MTIDNILNLSHFSDQPNQEEEVIEEEQPSEVGEPAVEEESTEEERAKEQKPVSQSFDISLDNSLIEELENKSESIQDSILREYGFKDIDELEATGEGGQQIAKILKLAEEKALSLRKAVGELKSLRENPTVKSAIVAQEITKIFQDNREVWLVEFSEDAPELFEKIKKVPKKVAAELAPKLDEMLGEYALKKKSNGKQITNPYLAMQVKIEKLIDGHLTTPTQNKETPKPTKPQIDTSQQKKIASLKSSGSAPVENATDSRLANLPKSRAQGIMSLSHLTQSLKIED